MSTSWLGEYFAKAACRGVANFVKHFPKNDVHWSDNPICSQRCIVNYLATRIGLVNRYAVDGGEEGIDASHQDV